MKAKIYKSELLNIGGVYNPIPPGMSAKALEIGMFEKIKDDEYGAYGIKLGPIEDEHLSNKNLNNNESIL